MVKHSVRAPSAGAVCERLGQHQGREHEDGRDQLEVVRIEAPRRARATISRNSSDPMTAPQIDRPKPAAGADKGLPQDHAREAPDNHTDAHLNVGESLVLGEDRARERHHRVGHHQADRDHPPDVRAECPDHPRVVAGGAHGRAQAGPEE